MTAMPSGLSTRMNSDRAKGTSWGYKCSMLWEEKTASTDSEETEDMSVMVPTKSGLTDSSMSKRSSFQKDRALVVRSLRLGPQPTCRKVFMGFILKLKRLVNASYPIHRLTVYVPHSVALMQLRFARRDQLSTGLAPVGVSPCWAHKKKPHPLVRGGEII